MRNRKKRPVFNWKKYILLILVGGAVLGVVVSFSKRIAVVLTESRSTLKSVPFDLNLGSDLDIVSLRSKLFHEMSGNSEVSGRDSWGIIQMGAAKDSHSITLYYTRRSISKDNKASREHQAEPDFWNREHLWPRSYGLKGSIADQDLHNLVAVDRTVNSSRGNKHFDNAVGEHYECLGCRVNDKVWEPPDIIKGDIARVLFYMDVRYEGGALEGPVEPDLVLGEDPDIERSQFGKLSTLLDWHCSDPVSEDEHVRQDIIDTAQGNRNVFIDHPSLVEIVYSYRCENL